MANTITIHLSESYEIDRIVVAVFLSKAIDWKELKSILDAIEKRERPSGHANTPIKWEGNTCVNSGFRVGGK